MKLILKDYPTKGEVACAKQNYDVGFYMFANFSQHDEEIASTNKTKYYTIVEDSSPSLDIEDFKLFLIEEGYNKDGAIIHAVMSPLEKYLNEKLTKNVANEETH